MRHSHFISCLLILPLFGSSAALAHPGEHGHMSFSEIIRHYAEPDHLAFLALVVIVGWLAYRWGRRIEAKARVVERRAPDARGSPKSPRNTQ